MENEQLADKIEKIHAESPDKGYRRLNDDLRHDYGIYVNDKRVLRICRAKDIRSTVKYNNHGYTRRAKNPQYLAENLLSRQFYADKPNEKWLTDVTKFKWYEGVEVHKLYLSAILDLCDRRIVFYALSERNDNPLVFKPWVNPKFCVNSIWGANRAKFIQGGSRGIRLPPCQQHNAGGVGCQGRRSCSACP